MVLKIYYFLFGHMRVFVKGFSYPRLLNMLSFRGIYIWNICEEKGGISFFSGAGNYEEVKALADKAGCAVMCEGERGLPVFLRKLKKKHMFCIGAAVFALSLLLITRFVWLVEVEGNLRVPTGELLEFCESYGLSYGALKSKLDTNMIEREIKNGFEDISFVSVSVKGTRALIMVSETIPLEENAILTEPADIIADCDGVITRIVSTRGKPFVREGMSVLKGDILISAEEEIKAEQEVLGIKTVRAEGKVYGKTVDEYSFELPKEETYKKYSERSYKQYQIEIFNKKFSLKIIKSDTNCEKCDRIESKKQLRLWNDIYLPIIIDCEEFLPYDDIKRNLDSETASLKARRIVTARIVNSYEDDSDVLDVGIEIKEEKDCYSVKAVITVDKQIGVLRAYSERPKESREL
ncbi:MAG: sporulation protein YqfD [Clostridiales bacterium]|nr:sporulation protein YqfD [Clostridiales bacterium]